LKIEAERCVGHAYRFNNGRGTRDIHFNATVEVENNRRVEADRVSGCEHQSGGDKQRHYNSCTG
jgi:hypothetical protein